jgi:hypothetical protein
MRSQGMPVAAAPQAFCAWLTYTRPLTVMAATGLRRQAMAQQAATKGHRPTSNSSTPWHARSHEGQRLEKWSTAVHACGANTGTAQTTVSPALLPSGKPAPHIQLIASDVDGGFAILTQRTDVWAGSGISAVHPCNVMSVLRVCYRRQGHACAPKVAGAVFTCPPQWPRLASPHPVSQARCCSARRSSAAGSRPRSRLLRQRACRWVDEFSRRWTTGGGDSGAIDQGQWAYRWVCSPVVGWMGGSGAIGG